jgi:hypothetical protein
MESRAPAPIIEWNVGPSPVQEAPKHPALFDDLRGNAIVGDMISRLPPPPPLPSSLTPPTSAAHTVPPEPFPDSRQRGIPVRLVSAVLGAIIIAAVFVAMRERGSDPQPPRTAAAAPAPVLHEPAAAPSPSPSEVPAPAVMPPAPRPEERVKEQAPPSNPTGKTIARSKPPSGKAALPTVTESARGAKGNGEPESGPEETPPTANKRPRPKLKQDAQPTIPENPY